MIQFSGLQDLPLRFLKFLKFQAFRRLVRSLVHSFIRSFILEPGLVHYRLTDSEPRRAQAFPEQTRTVFVGGGRALFGKQGPLYIPSRRDLEPRRAQSFSEQGRLLSDVVDS